jgi:hypothetical protein
MIPVVKLASEFKNIVHDLDALCTMQLNNTSWPGVIKTPWPALHLVHLLS